MEFEEPNFQQAEKKQERKGSKIWMAIGIIMLIIGLNLHGLNHQPFEISLKPSDLKQLKADLRELGSQENRIRVPLFVSAKAGQSKDIALLDIEEQEFPEIRVKEKSESEISEEPEVVEVSREFFLQLQGEIDAIGNYL